MGIEITDGSESAVVARLGLLTNVQRRCLELTLDHLSSKEIAHRLGITPDSVDWHMREARRKLEAPSRVAAALMLRDYRPLESHQSLVGFHQRLVHQPLEVVVPPLPANVEASTDGWSEDDAAATSNELSEATRDVDWLPTEAPRGQADHGRRRLDGVIPRPWGSANTLRVQQRLILILIIAGFSALSFGAVVASLVALRNLV